MDGCIGYCLDWLIKGSVVICLNSVRFEPDSNNDAFRTVAPSLLWLGIDRSMDDECLDGV